MENNLLRKQVLNVLIIEDNPGDVLIIQNLLKTSGIEFSITHSSTISDAIPLLSGQKFDAVLLDIGLPDCLGLETLNKIKVSKVQAPVVILTGLEDENTALASLKEGAQDYLVKNNLNSENILHTIKYSIERKKLQEIQKRHTQRFSILSLATSAINECEEVSSIYKIIL